MVIVFWHLMQDRGHWPASRDISHDQGRAGLAPALHRPGVRVDDSQDAGKRVLIVSSVVVANTFCPAPSGPQHQALGDWVLGLRRSFCKTYQPFAVFCWHNIFRTLCCRGRRLRNGAGLRAHLSGIALSVFGSQSARDLALLRWRVRSRGHRSSEHAPGGCSAEGYDPRCRASSHRCWAGS